jgi:hypothetical protein
MCKQFLLELKLQVILQFLINGGSHSSLQYSYQVPQTRIAKFVPGIEKDMNVNFKISASAHTQKQSLQSLISSKYVLRSGVTQLSALILIIS